MHCFSLLLLFLTFAALSCNSSHRPLSKAFTNLDLITRFSGFDASVEKFSILALFLFQFAEVSESLLHSPFQGFGQKTKQDLLKEESEKMKVFTRS